MTSRDVSRVPQRAADFLDPMLSFRFPFDRFFPDAFAERAAASGFNPAVDVTETGTQIRIHADLPGVDEKDVELSIDNDVVTLRGERRSESREEGANRHIVERSWGAFQRSIRLPFRPEETSVSATFREGVLEVEIAKPKETEPRTNRIPIRKG